MDPTLYPNPQTIAQYAHHKIPSNISAMKMVVRKEGRQSPKPHGPPPYFVIQKPLARGNALLFTTNAGKAEMDHPYIVEDSLYR